MALDVFDVFIISFVVAIIFISVAAADVSKMLLSDVVFDVDVEPRAVYANQPMSLRVSAYKKGFFTTWTYDVTCNIVVISGDGEVVQFFALEGNPVYRIIIIDTAGNYTFNIYCVVMRWVDAEYRESIEVAVLSQER